MLKAFLENKEYLGYYSSSESSSENHSGVYCRTNSCKINGSKKEDIRGWEHVLNITSSSIDNSSIFGSTSNELAPMRVRCGHGLTSPESVELYASNINDRLLKAWRGGYQHLSSDVSHGNDSKKNNTVILKPHGYRNKKKYRNGMYSSTDIMMDRLPHNGYGAIGFSPQNEDDSRTYDCNVLVQSCFTGHSSSIQRPLLSPDIDTINTLSDFPSTKPLLPPDSQSGKLSDKMSVSTLTTTSVHPMNISSQRYTSNISTYNNTTIATHSDDYSFKSSSIPHSSVILSNKYTGGLPLTLISPPWTTASDDNLKWREVRNASQTYYNTNVYTNQIENNNCTINKIRQNTSSVNVSSVSVGTCTEMLACGPDRFLSESVCKENSPTIVNNCQPTTEISRQSDFRRENEDVLHEKNLHQLSNERFHLEQTNSSFGRHNKDCLLNFSHNDLQNYDNSCDEMTHIDVPLPPIVSFSSEMSNDIHGEDTTVSQESLDLPFTDIGSKSDEPHHQDYDMGHVVRISEAGTVVSSRQHSSPFTESESQFSEIDNNNRHKAFNNDKDKESLSSVTTNYPLLATTEIKHSRHRHTERITTTTSLTSTRYSFGDHSEIEENIMYHQYETPISLMNDPSPHSVDMVSTGRQGESTTPIEREKNGEYNNADVMDHNIYDHADANIVFNGESIQCNNDMPVTNCEKDSDHQLRELKKDLYVKKDVSLYSRKFSGSICEENVCLSKDNPNSEKCYMSENIPGNNDNYGSCIEASERCYSDEEGLVNNHLSQQHLQTPAVIKNTINKAADTDSSIDYCDSSTSPTTSSRLLSLDNPADSSNCKDLRKALITEYCSPKFFSSGPSRQWRRTRNTPPFTVYSAVADEFPDFFGHIGLILNMEDDEKTGASTADNCLEVGTREKELIMDQPRITVTTCTDFHTPARRSLQQFMGVNKNTNDSERSSSKKQTVTHIQSYEKIDNSAVMDMGKITPADEEPNEEKLKREGNRGNKGGNSFNHDIHIGINAGEMKYSYLHSVNTTTSTPITYITATPTAGVVIEHTTTSIVDDTTDNNIQRLNMPDSPPPHPYLTSPPRPTTNSNRNSATPSHSHVYEKGSYAKNREKNGDSEGDVLQVESNGNKVHYKNRLYVSVESYHSENEFTDEGSIKQPSVKSRNCNATSNPNNIMHKNPAICTRCERSLPLSQVASFSRKKSKRHPPIPLSPSLHKLTQPPMRFTSRSFNTHRCSVVGLTQEPQRRVCNYNNMTFEIACQRCLKCNRRIQQCPIPESLRGTFILRDHQYPSPGATRKSSSMEKRKSHDRTNSKSISPPLSRACGPPQRNIYHSDDSTVRTSATNSKRNSPIRIRRIPSSPRQRTTVTSSNLVGDSGHMDPALQTPQLNVDDGAWQNATERSPSPIENNYGDDILGDKGDVDARWCVNNDVIDETTKSHDSCNESMTVSSNQFNEGVLEWGNVSPQGQNHPLPVLNNITHVPVISKPPLTGSGINNSVLVSDNNSFRLSLSDLANEVDVPIMTSNNTVYLNSEGGKNFWDVYQKVLGSDYCLSSRSNDAGESNHDAVQSSLDESTMILGENTVGCFNDSVVSKANNSAKTHERCPYNIYPVSEPNSQFHKGNCSEGDNALSETKSTTAMDVEDTAAPAQKRNSRKLVGKEEMVLYSTNTSVSDWSQQQCGRGAMDSAMSIETKRSDLALKAMRKQRYDYLNSKEIKAQELFHQRDMKRKKAAENNETHKNFSRGFTNVPISEYLRSKR